MERPLPNNQPESHLDPPLTKQERHIDNMNHFTGLMGHNFYREGQLQKPKEKPKTVVQ